MNITFAPRGILQIDDARIIYRNFAGRGDKFNREGDRNFAVVIDDQAVADELIELGWNVKIKAPREEGDDPFIYLPIKLKFNERGPKIYLKSGKHTVPLSEETVGTLDNMNIVSIDLDIRPYDGDIQGPFRAAYVQSLWVTQEVDRFAARFAEEEYPEE